MCGREVLESRAELGELGTEVGDLGVRERRREGGEGAVRITVAFESTEADTAQTMHVRGGGERSRGEAQEQRVVDAP